MKTCRGFTLIEVMIVVAIVAILAAIAFPSYARYVEQARRADAKVALLDAAQRLERCYTQNNTYVDCTFIADSPDGHYLVAATVQTAFEFTLTATPRPGGVQESSPCGTYSIDHEGTRTVSTGLDRCW